MQYEPKEINITQNLYISEVCSSTEVERERSLC